MTIRLTSLSTGGGCGCKIAPDLLQSFLERGQNSSLFGQHLKNDENLVVGINDDAAVYKFADRYLISTIDFFMPIVDDPRDFGRIAASNAISDIYAMGGVPHFALAILGVPSEKLSPDDVGHILSGGAEICRSIGVAVAGGHSIDSPVPIYGLAVNGSCKPEELRTQAMAKDGDAVILTKPLGVGIYSAALKQSALDQDGYEEMLSATTQLNFIGAELGKESSVHAMTDVTGFGLIGHCLNISRASTLAMHLSFQSLPLLDQCMGLANRNYVTGASSRNWRSYTKDVHILESMPVSYRHIISDPQTSGGLLFTCEEKDAQRLVKKISAKGFHRAAIIGEMKKGHTGITITRYL